ncbi:uncharacterized protein [Periplaneta americana]|uniref:uncharacterized protein isoform X2 n=1 Tax=Periplaneta americana TaxID=6978 RepID=UPI0037E7BB61
MAGAQCQLFVQNAWKKDLCANCFKCREEHGAPGEARRVPLVWRPQQGILKVGRRLRRPAGSTVHFPAEESQVIGFGGDDSLSSDGEEEPEESPPGVGAGAGASDDDDEEQRALQKLTRNNTDFNTVAANLAGTGASPSTVETRLMLGRPLTDSDGRRKTLQVSVTPFGKHSEIPGGERSGAIVLKSVVRSDEASRRPSLPHQNSRDAMLKTPATDAPSRIPVIKSRTSPTARKLEPLAALKKAGSVAAESSPPPSPDKKGTTEPPTDVPDSGAQPQANEDITTAETTDESPSPCTEQPSEEPAIVETRNPEVKPPEEAESPKEEPERKVEGESPVDMLSRELAGEPDGRADPDELTEPPALPRSPPPIIDPRPSFLHTLTQVRKPPGDKPKVPLKPSTKILQATPRRQPAVVTPATTPPPQEPPPPQEEVAPQPAPELPEPECTEQPPERSHKRQAPKPPQEESPCPLFTRNASLGLIKASSPVAREKGKRERAASCPEPAPRRSLSLSAESLGVEVPDKKKASRFSLRKFLRLGAASKEERAAVAESPQRPEEALPVPRPRLEIIHPLELNGSNVEVLSSSKRPPEDSAPSTPDEPEPAPRPTKPPPPPRSQSLDAWGKTLEGLGKPARPPPPKSAELLRQQKLASPQAPPPAPLNNVYANLGLLAGEVRSGLTPSKPQRSSSIRDGSAEGPKRRAAPPTDDSGYESVELSSAKNDVGENLYECVAPVFDSDPEVKQPRYNGMLQRRSEGSVDTCPDFIKFRGSFMRSASLPYCSSETESEIYSAYSFYGSEDVGDDDSEWSPSSGHPWKTSKLRLRKGRSVVHKSLEDNYGAVIVANHEALAQVLEQVQAGTLVPPALRGLKSALNLRWTDFTVDESRPVVVGRRSFCSALWGAHGVTLSLTVDQTLQSGVSSGGCFSLRPLTEFSDLVPARFLPGQPPDKEDLMQASVVVLRRAHVDSVQTYGAALRARPPGDERWRDAGFALLQLVHALKTLQAQGVEEAPQALSGFVLSREERDAQPRLSVLPAPRDDAPASLCQCALGALRELLGAAPLAPLLGDLLRRERAESLSQAKAVLEFSLWGPADVALGAPPPDRELVLQRWLDLERATVLHGLVRTRVELSALEECHLLFLVRTGAKMMCEASLLLDSSAETTSF